MSISCLNLLVIRSSDVKNLVVFYECLGLHFEEHQHGDSAITYAGRVSSTVFEIYPATEKNTSTIGVRFGFETSEIVDSMEKIRSSRGTVLSEPKKSPWGLGAVVADPEVHRIEFVQPV